MLPLLPIIVISIIQASSLHADNRYTELVQIAVKHDCPLKVFVNTKEFKCSACGKNDPIVVYVSNDDELVGYCAQCVDDSQDMEEDYNVDCAA